jgi:restriction system protein
MNHSLNNQLSKVPQFSQLMHPVLTALKALGGSGTNEEILEKVVELEKIPDEVQKIQHLDHKETALAYRLAWARTYLKSVGALANSGRGVWAITDRGRSLTEKECLGVAAQVRKAGYEKRKKQQQLEDDGAPGADSDESEVLTWKDTLLTTLQKLKPDAFERLSQRLLREAGFTKVQVLGKSGDGGIDGIGILRVNLVSFVVLFQCKRYQGSVGASAIRDFRGAMMGRCDKGLVITTGTFSNDARKEATRDGAPAIDLIDGDSFCDLLKSLKLGLDIEHVEKVTIREDWFKEI